MCIRQASAKIGVNTKRKNGTIIGWKSRNITSYPENFWIKVLDNNSISYKREKVVRKSDGKNNYFLDFLIEIGDIKIDLEIDGKQHKYPDRVESDAKRDLYLIELGFYVYRIDWNEINTDEGKSKMKSKIDQFIDFYNFVYSNYINQYFE